jgi:DNA-binding protein YbaB
MSIEIECASQPSEQAIAHFLQENDVDRLTDVLVQALYEALRIMDDDVSPETFH